MIIHIMVLWMSVLVLTNQVLIVASMTPKPCSDSVPLTQNVNGHISFKPGGTVVAGAKVTIRCQGIDGQPTKAVNPDHVKIIEIKIFGTNSLLHTCNGDSLRQRECQYNITETKRLGQSLYHCLFLTSVQTSYSCISSKNLTTTDDVCLTKPSPCHQNATCTKTNSSFECKCNERFTGDGKNCTEGKSQCAFNSTCLIEHDPSNCNISKSTLQCHCQENFIGNGTHCTKGKLQCAFNSTCLIEHDPSYCNISKSTLQCHCQENFIGNGTHCTKGKLQCAFNSTCRIEHDPSNCNISKSTLQCHCQENFIGNGTHCTKVISDVGPSMGETSSSKTIIIVVVVTTFTLLIIFAITVSFYQKRKKIDRAETFNRAVHEMNKGRSASKDNLGIIFPDGEEIVASSPRRKLPSIRDHNSMEEEPDEEGIDISYICVLDDWEIEKEKLTVLNKKLGGGYFGVVKKGIYKHKENDNLTVAVKMLKDSPSAADRSDLLMELYILKEVNKNPHPNVIKLIGAFTSEEPILVITEFCSRGNLRHLLRKSRMPENNDGTTEYTNIFSTLCHKKLLQIAVDIANGMQHLAANQFVHRDLAARNILIGENFEAKVSDFGLARPITGIDQMYVKSNRNLLPVKWMAVESLTHGVFRTSSDVWSFGVVLWEIATLGNEPYPDIDSFETFTLVASGKRMEKPAQCCEELYNIMTKCWEHDQEKRPSFIEIHGQLKEMFAETDRRMYINVVELCEESTNALEDDRRISVASIGGDLRYTNSIK